MDTVKVHKWVVSPDGAVEWVECEIPADILIYQDPTQ